MSKLISKYPYMNILGINVANVTLSNINPIIANLIKENKKTTLFGLNAHNYNLFTKNAVYRKAIKNASFVYPEGTSIIIASKLARNRLQGKTTLMDFMADLLKIFERNNWSLYILGGAEEVSKKAYFNIQKQFPKLKIYSYNGYFKKNETQKVISNINKKKPTVLFVAMGSPKQEIWINKYKNQIDANAFFGIGGSIDVIAGVIPRAPKKMTENGLEWLYRFYKEPRRMWKRYLLGNTIFLLRIPLHLLKQL